MTLKCGKNKNVGLGAQTEKNEKLSINLGQ